MADEELKKAFQELQFRTNETRGRISQGEINKKNYVQQKRIAEVTSGALGDIAPNFPVYRSVGRMFVLSNKDDEVQRYQTESKTLGEKVESIDKQREYLEKGLQEAENNLREMVQSRRS